LDCSIYRDAGSAMTDNYLRTLEDLARPFIGAGLYDSKEAFLRDVVKDMAQHKAKSYERTVRKYQRRYKSWKKFTTEIEGKATPAQEDEWMEWEAARNMLKAWKELAKGAG
jgi:lipopolysaccharide biosynthesis regulator YciM